MAIRTSFSRCALCGELIPVEAAAVSFPPFVANERDPLYPLNDANVHEACFAAFPHRERALVESRWTKPSEIRCDLCGELVVPENLPVAEAVRFFDAEFVGFPRFTDRPERLAFRYNLKRGHRACFVAEGYESGLSIALDELAVADDEWDLESLRKMREALRRVFSAP